MCGRYTHLFTWKQLHRLMQLATPAQMDLPLRYNVAPMQAAPVVLEGGDSGRHVEMMRWGLVPSWANDETIGNRTINARSETAATTPAFRSAMRRRRCLVPASGFYEWEKLGERNRPPKQPWYITPADDDLFAFAGLWDEWKGEGSAEPVRTFTILTTSANDAVAPLHNRMPVVLSQDQFAAWLDPRNEDAAAVSALLGPCPPARIRKTRVGTWVNTPAHEDARCIEPAEVAREPGLFG